MVLKIETITPHDAARISRNRTITAFFVGFSDVHRGVVLMCEISESERASFFLPTPVASQVCEGLDQAAQARQWPLTLPDREIEPTEADWDASQRMRVVTGIKTFAFEDVIAFVLRLEDDHLEGLRWPVGHVRSFAEGVLHEIGSGRFRDARTEEPPTTARH